jgi:hypothetical protein
MINELIEECQTLINELQDDLKHDLRDSELNFVHGLWEALTNIETQVLNKNYDSGLEDCLTDLKEMLKHRLKCIETRENHQKEVEA